VVWRDFDHAIGFGTHAQHDECAAGLGLRGRDGDADDLARLGGRGSDGAFEGFGGRNAAASGPAAVRNCAASASRSGTDLVGSLGLTSRGGQPAGSSSAIFPEIKYERRWFPSSLSVRQNGSHIQRRSEQTSGARSAVIR